MTDRSWEDKDWARDFATSRFPRDRLAVASVILASLWLWWVGSVAGLVLGIVALARARTRPEPLTSRRWARTGIVLGLIGVVTFAAFVAPPLITNLRHHFEDTAARATLADFVTTLKNEDNPHLGGFPTSLGAAESWLLPGGSGIVVVSPGTSSSGYKKVSAEVWDLWLDPAPNHGVTVYAAVLSGSGSCFYLRENDNVAYEIEPFGAGTCTADHARSSSNWSPFPTL
jgi:Domain of unknown function (DUF4190)